MGTSLTKVAFRVNAGTLKSGESPPGPKGNLSFLSGSCWGHGITICLLSCVDCVGDFGTWVWGRGPGRISVRVQALSDPDAPRLSGAFPAHLLEGESLHHKGDDFACLECGC